MKKIFKTCLDWGKRHTFHFIMVIILSIMGFAIISQQLMINSLQGQVDEVPDLIKTSEVNTALLVHGKSVVLKNKINSVSESINARIDTVDSAIKPDKKRRMLITKIRDAINENTNRNIGVRDLNRMANAVIDYSYEFNLTIPQVLAQIRVESNFDPYAVSSANARGLMQILPTTLKLIQYEMPNAPAKLNTWNIHHNIRAGCFYMSEQIERFGTYEEALRAYNWGPDNLARFNADERKTEPIETVEYVPKVKHFIEIFEKYGLE
jgi:hypothetical protein